MKLTKQVSERQRSPISVDQPAGQEQRDITKPTNKKLFAGNRDGICLILVVSQQVVQARTRDRPANDENEDIIGQHHAQGR